MHDLSTLVAAFALAASVPLGRALSRWRGPGQHAVESFAAGVTLAYVIEDLMVELTGVGGAHVHAALPIGPTEEKSLFAVVLGGMISWYVVAALAAKGGGARARYLASVLPRVVYGVVVGGALALEAEHGDRALLLFAPAMLLHLTVTESQIHGRFERDHFGVVGVMRGIAPGLGATAWALLGVPQPALFVALALVAGSTVVQIIQTEVPSPDLVRIGPLVLGVCVYSAFIAARWAA
jgi:hypothetical protein